MTQPPVAAAGAAVCSLQVTATEVKIRRAADERHGYDGQTVKGARATSDPSTIGNGYVRAYWPDTDGRRWANSWLPSTYVRVISCRAK